MEAVSIHLLLWMALGSQVGRHHLSLSGSSCSCPMPMPQRMRWSPDRWSVGPLGQCSAFPRSPLLLWGREGQTRLPSGHPAVCPPTFSGLCIYHTSASGAAPRSSASPLTLHSFTGIMRLRVSLPCPLKSWPTDWGQEPSPSSRHTVSSSLIGSGFSTLSFRHF